MNSLRQFAERFHELAQTGATNGSPPMTITALANACDPLLYMANLMGPFAEAWREEIVAKVSLRAESSPLI